MAVQRELRLNGLIMAKENDVNGWNQHKIDVLNRLDRMEGMIKEMQADRKEDSLNISKIYTALAVIKTKVAVVSASIAATLTIAWHYISPLLK